MATSYEEKMHIVISIEGSGAPAAECGSTTIISALLSHGAEMTKDDRRMTPLIVAAERVRAVVVEWFIQCAGVSKEETIEAYELLGASYANSAYKSNYYLAKAYKYFWKAMELRYVYRVNHLNENT